MGALFDAATDFWSLRAAARAAARGCAGSVPAARFLADLETEVLRLQRELRSGTYRPGALHTFAIREPKPRMISAAPFRDRVVHHSVCAALDAVFEEAADPDSFACRRGKGTLKALHRIQEHARQWPWFAKVDVLHCFETIDLDVLREALRERIPDPLLLALIELFLVVGAEPGGRGLPIGNLTSQHFSNLLLGAVDREARRLGVCGWVRYMDDMFLFGPNRVAVKSWADTLAAFIADGLRQQEKVSARRLGRTSGGISALGFRVWPQRVRFDGARRRRFLRRLRTLDRWIRDGHLAEAEAARRAVSMVGWAEQADTLGLRRSLVASSAR